MVERDTMFDVSRHSPIIPVAIAMLVPSLGCGGTSQNTAESEPVRLEDDEIADAPNGIAFPRKYKNWPVLSVTHRADKQSLSVVVGNLEAVRAARNGKTNPWPDGSVIGHLVFDQSDEGVTPGALTSGRFIRAEFMFKKLEAYAANSSGWGWARWDGQELAPFGSDGFEEDCIDCHKKVSGSDWLFSTPINVP